MPRVRSALLALAFAALACRKASPPAPAASAAPAGAVPMNAPGPKKLPEDPVKGAKATAQWSEHLAEEERERKLTYDKAHRSEHEAILAALEQAQARYVAAKTKAQVTVAAASFTATLPALRKKVDGVDPKRKSSNLLTDYDSILAALEKPYAEARIAALAGDTKAEQALRTDLEQRLAKARAWLEEEGEAEGKKSGRDETDEARERAERH